MHEFIELHNFSREPVTLDNWRISGGIEYAFPTGTKVESGAYLVVAKDPKRLASIKEYRLGSVTVLGPYEGVLSNNGEQVSVENDGGNTEDSVRYSALFPWPIGADSIGAGPKWTGIDPMTYQYRGMSLERVNFSLPGQRPCQLGHLANRKKTLRPVGRTTLLVNAPCRLPLLPSSAQSTARGTP